jgi:hypothetical protein
VRTTPHTVQQRQPQVEDHDVGIDLPGPLDGLPAVVRDGDLEAVPLQIAAHQLGKSAFVIHDQSPAASGRFGPVTGSAPDFGKSH